MTVQETKAVVQRFFEEALSTGNLDLMDELFAAEYKHYGFTSGDPIRDREATKQTAAVFFAAFPDIRCAVEDQVAEQELIVTRYALHGTQQGEFNGIPASGRTIRISGIACHRVKDDKITDDWPGLDLMGMMQQLGVISQSART